MGRDAEIAEAAKERDGHTCVKCGVQHSSKTRFNAHHIVPLHAGGEDELSNVATLCPHCHRFAPELLRNETLYEPVFEDYVATGTRPELDLARFGSDMEVNSEGMDEIFSTLLEFQRSAEDDSEITQPEFYWLAMAAAAEYGALAELR